MVSKSRKENAGKKQKVKVLNLKKETVKNLTDAQAKRVKGGTTTCLIGGVRPRLSGIAQTITCAGLQSGPFSNFQGCPSIT
jgi:hypothetical protein